MTTRCARSGAPTSSARATVRTASTPARGATSWRAAGAADILLGGTGQDRLLGNGGKELDGGLHRDICIQGPGTGERVNCENHKVLALAFTDLDGDHAFGGNDVLIARLSDTDDDKVPSAGDTVEDGPLPRRT